MSTDRMLIFILGPKKVIRKTGENRGVPIEILKCTDPQSSPNTVKFNGSNRFGAMKNSSSHPGSIMHKMTCRDHEHDDNSSQPR